MPGLYCLVLCFSMPGYNNWRWEWGKRNQEQWLDRLLRALFKSLLCLLTAKRRKEASGDVIFQSQ